MRINETRKDVLARCVYYFAAGRSIDSPLDPRDRFIFAIDIRHEALIGRDDLAIPDKKCHR
jgi:hypothetical protein